MRVASPGNASLIVVRKWLFYLVSSYSMLRKGSLMSPANHFWRERVPMTAGFAWFGCFLVIDIVLGFLLLLELELHGCDVPSHKMQRRRGF
jgi:hypothetical protein